MWSKGSHCREKDLSIKSSWRDFSILFTQVICSEFRRNCCLGTFPGLQGSLQHGEAGVRQKEGRVHAGVRGCRQVIILFLSLSDLVIVFLFTSIRFFLGLLFRYSFSNLLNLIWLLIDTHNISLWLNFDFTVFSKQWTINQTVVFYSLYICNLLV